MTYRQIAQVAKCSPGAVGAELRAMKSEKLLIPTKMLLIEKSSVLPILSSGYVAAEEFEILRF